jgi:hypothetical protein
MIKNRRELFAKGLHPVYFTYYRSLCGLLPPYWQPISGLRSMEEQTKLYDQGRKTPGAIVTNARAGSSFHNYGLATDWGYFSDWGLGKWVDLKANDPKWKEYQDACDKVGLRTIEWDKPHNEFPLPFPISRLQKAWLTGGMEAVSALLKNVDTLSIPEN